MFLKRILLFLSVAFLVVDVMLMLMYVQTRNNTLVLSEQIVADTVDYYNNIGIKIDESVIERKIPENTIYTYSGTNYEVSEEIAKKISYKMFSTGSISFLEAPDGIIYLIDDGGNTSANFRVSNDGYGFDYSVSGYENINSKYPFDKFKGDKISSTLDSGIKRMVSKFVSCLSENSDSEYTVLGSSRTINGMFVYLCQNVYDSFMIRDMHIRLYFEQNELKSVTGMWIFPEMEKSYYESLNDGINALRKMEESKIKEIVSQNIEYIYKSSGQKDTYLIPVWKLTYIDVDGDKKIQYIDSFKK